MRPNYAQDAPPTEILVGGFSYACNTDYRIWIEVLRLMGDIRLDDQTEEGLDRTANQIIELEELVFGGFLSDESPADVLKAISDFAKGYPTAPSHARSEEETYSFDYDLNEIIIAIRNQSGIDLSYRRTEPFHWWEFLLEFRTLCGNHYILNLMEIRGYKGKDAEMRKRRQEYALPERFTAAELEEYAAFSAEFDTDDNGESANQEGDSVHDQD